MDTVASLQLLAKLSLFNNTIFIYPFVFLNPCLEIMVDWKMSINAIEVMLYDFYGRYK